MNEKIKILGAIIVTSVMLLLAFTGIITHIQSRKDVNEPQAEANFVDIAKYQHQNNGIMLNRSEINDLYHFVLYNYLHYGISSNELSELQFKADSNFINWYLGNYSQIPSNYRGITTQNASVILPMWENESSNAMEDVQAVANYEVSQFTIQNQINTSYVVNNHLGHLVSNKTTVYDNQSANLLTYRYTNGKKSLVYGLIDQNGTIKPVDPYIRLNAFTIHWGWGGLISGKSYNIYFTFTNLKNAYNFKQFLVSSLTVKSWVQALFVIVGEAAAATALGTVIGVEIGKLKGAIVGAIVGGIASIAFSIYDILSGAGDPGTMAANINAIFLSQELHFGTGSDFQFELVDTLNAWNWGLTPEFSWWGYEYPTGSSPVLTQVFRSIGVKSSAEGNFESMYNSLVNHYNYGVNQEHAFDGPGSWASFEKKLLSAGVIPAL